MLTRVGTAVAAMALGTGMILLYGAPAYGCPTNTICVNPGASGSTGGGGGTTGSGPTGGGSSGGTGTPPPCPVILTTCNNAPNAAPAAPVWTPPRDYAIAAFDQQLLPAPNPQTTPRSPTFVGLSTYLWIRSGVWKTFYARAGIAGEQVVAKASPSALTWKVGDGAPELTCHGAGSPTNSSCAHTYQRSSIGRPGGKYTIEATMTWTVSWTCTGALCRNQTAGTLNPIVRPSGIRSLVVREIQTESTPL
jgi:hypothetical protein